MIRMLAFDFPKDAKALEITDQYLFGDSLMVCPVTETMYYKKSATVAEKQENPSKVRNVYLPEGCGWYDFWTNKYYEGGQWIEAEAPIERIPLFVKEGSILPMQQSANSTAETVMPENLTFIVYAKKDCSYELYTDDGDGYAYENGAYTLETYMWNQSEQILRDSKGREVDRFRVKVVSAYGEVSK